MDRDTYRNPEQLSGYTGGETGDPADQSGPPVRKDGQSAAENRGMRAPDAGSGAVIGSGAGDGPAGGAEDYDPELSRNQRPRPARPER